MNFSVKDKSRWPLPDDLYVFLTVVRKQSFASAAAELGLSPAYVSKRINILEKKLNTRLFYRNTRYISLTPDGERARDGTIKVLDTMSGFVTDLSIFREEVKGNLHICCSFGFGRTHITPALSKLSKKFSELNVKLTLTDREIDLVSEGVDIEIRLGDNIKDQYIAKKLSANKRILCAAPKYLELHGSPSDLVSLSEHECLVIQERNSPFGVWELTNDQENRLVHVSGRMSSNSGSVILKWALEGHGIIFRSLWDVQEHLKTGRLVQVLPDFYQSANIWAVYPTRSSGSAMLKTAVEFLQDYFQKNPPIMYDLLTERATV